MQGTQKYKPDLESTSGNEMWKRNIQEITERYDALAKDIKVFVMDHIAKTQLLKLFQNRFDILTIRGGLLCISGSVIPPLQYDSDSCFAVFADTRNRFNHLCKSLLSNWKTFRESESAKQYLIPLACWYNSFLCIYEAIPRMCREALLENPHYCYLRGESAFFGKNEAAQDQAEAVKLYSKAAECGHMDAQYSLGYCYYHGQGVEEDRATAVEWFRKAATQGHNDARYHLGCCYYDGMGVAEDKAQAAQWWLAAAEQAHVLAQHSLGDYYYHDAGPTHRRTEAMEWWRRAADQGYPPAKMMLEKLMG